MRILRVTCVSKITEQCRLKMTENDIKTGKELLKEDFIRKNKEWTKELEIMVCSTHIHISLLSSIDAVHKMFSMKCQLKKSTYSICIHFSHCLPSVTTCTSQLGQDKDESGNTGSFIEGFSIYHGGIPSCQTGERRLDIISTRGVAVGIWFCM